MPRGVVGLAFQVDHGLHACHAGMMGKMVADRSLQSSPRIFYGWFVVAGAFAVTFVGFGSAYTFSAFIASLQRDFAASRGSVSLVFSVAGFLYFALGLVSGPLADRFGARLLAVAGMILTGLGLAVASLARSLPEVYAAYRSHFWSGPCPPASGRWPLLPLRSDCSTAAG
jgi:MFS family permease